MTNMMRARPTEAKMAEPDDFSAAERRQRRKLTGLIAIAIGLGVATALAFAGSDQDAGTIAPAIAAAGAAVYVAMMTLGTWAMIRITDEVEVYNNVLGLAAGAGAVLLVYPSWWMLWRGGLVREPTHDAVFLLMFGAALIAYLWKKYR